MTYDPGRAAAFYDEYGEREWTRFDDGRTSPGDFAVHLHYLSRFVKARDRALDVGAGPGRFTIELARLGARIVVADLSPVQLELNREKVVEAGFEDAVEERILADVLDLPFPDASFDVTVCYGGPLTYVLERAPEAAAELARVTRRGGHVLVSVMSLIGAAATGVARMLDDARRRGVEAVESVVSTGYLPPESGGHSGMKLFRWRELEALLAPHGDLVAASSCGLLPAHPEEPELRDLLGRLEVELGAEPGVLDAGSHMLAVVRR